jgi:hypothetical protein
VIVFGSNEIPCLADVAGTTLFGLPYPVRRSGFDFDLNQGAKARRSTSFEPRSLRASGAGNDARG